MTGFKYGTKSCGERAGQRIDRKRESVKDRVLLKMRDGMGNKFDHWSKYLWQMLEINLRQLRYPPKIVFPQLEYFLCYLLATFHPADKLQILYNMALLLCHRLLLYIEFL